MRKLAFDPFWRAVAEIFSTIFFTFGPFILLSIPFTPKAGELSQDAVRANFWSFWERGELVLPFLALAGALVSLAALNKHALHGSLNFLSWIIALGLAVAGGFVLAQTNGFSEDIHHQFIVPGFWGYALILLFWGVVSFRVHTFNLTSEVDKPNPEERADRLNRLKTAVKEGGAK